MRLTILGSTLFLGVAAVAAAGACNREGANPPLVASSGTPQAGGGEPDASFEQLDSTAPITSSGVTTLASGLVSPRAIALGPTTVYWTTGQVASAGAPVGDAATGTGGLESVPRAGGARAELVAGLANPTNLAISDTTLYFAEGSAGVGTVDAFLLGGTTTTAIATGQSPPLPMIAYEGTLYWTGGDGAKLDTEAVSTSGGGVKVLDSYPGDYQPVATTLVGSVLYVLTTGSHGASILSLSITGGDPTVLWEDATLTPSDLASAGTTLYWIVSGSAEGSEILAMPISGGSPTPLASNLDAPAKLVVDGSEIYFSSDVASGSILEVSTGGGDVTTLADGLDYPYALAVDDAVYFATATTVARVPK